MINKLFQSIQFLNEESITNILSNYEDMIRSGDYLFIDGLFYLYTKKGFYYDDKTDKHPVIKDKITFIYVPTIDVKIAGYSKIYGIDKSFLTPLKFEEGFTNDDILNRIYHDAKIISDKMKQSNLFKVNCDEIRETLKNINSEYNNKNFNNNFFKNIIKIRRSGKYITIVDKENIDIITNLQWFGSDLGSMISIKYNKYLDCIYTASDSNLKNKKIELEIELRRPIEIVEYR